eukprot:10168842-Ditylum_brightwellii.AAC.1
MGKANQIRAGYTEAATIVMWMCTMLRNGFKAGWVSAELLEEQLNTFQSSPIPKEEEPEHHPNHLTLYVCPKYKFPHHCN